MPKAYNVEHQRPETEIHRIEDIEKFCPELQVGYCLNPRAFDDARIHLKESRPIHRIAREIAELTGRRQAEYTLLYGRC